MPVYLETNKFQYFDLEVKAPAAGSNDESEFSNPYWLQQPHGDMYQINPLEIGDAVNRPLLEVEAGLTISGINIAMKIPVRYKWRDRVEGELQRDLAVAPPVLVNFSEPMYTSLNGAPVKMEVRLKWFADSGRYTLKFHADGWQLDKNEFTLDAKGYEAEEWISFSMKPVQKSPSARIEVKFADGTPARSFSEVSYSHISPQVIQLPASATITLLNLKKTGSKVAYINGAGDRVAQGIAQMGYVVDVLGETDLATRNLSQYQAIVMGVRAYNTQLWLPNYSEKLLSYVFNGGKVIVQYNTASRFLEEKPLVQGPFPFTIGSGRVTEEDSPVTMMMPLHPVLQSPNRITEDDFSNWVQERGLYFAQKWDERYQTPISWSDSGKEAETGALIIGNYGKGAFMYTGISFFRQLPAGVPGAYRLLANLISYQPKK
jgi:hypothetical protein